MASVTVIDRGWKRIEREARVLARRSIKVGIRAGPVQDGVEIVDYAVYNEYGTDEIPSRPFMRRTADNAQPDLSNFARLQVGAMMDGAVNANGLLTRVGLWFRRRIQETIRTSPTWATPNALATIAMKGSDVPLIDHAAMLNAVDFEIT